ncbi:conserved exported protein of unknown function [Candidatus Methylocalor cossyra]|uniref:UrcA family protein n=2 Tax=Candidatus Methylocalor cossyra TaxID=3108543 RepID=A0ABM9NLL4_9GAMM
MTPYSEAMTTKFLAPITFLGLAAALGPVHAEEGNWEPSTLSQATQDRVHAALSAYQRCVDGETRAHLNDRADSRRVTEAILRACEDPLTAIKTAFDAEHVPAALSERYLRSKRSLAAQQILRLVMANQAVRAADPQR